MQKTILTLLGSVLLVATVTQAASANERHGRRVACACASAPALPQQFRDSSGTVWTAEPGWSPAAPYYSHAFAAPAGH